MKLLAVIVIIIIIDIIQVVRTHQHNTNSAVLETARCLKTEVQRETRKMKESIAEKKKTKRAREENAWTIAT